ncbi:MAG: hypothetical protein KAY65_16615 [Planctomycetes bacterium]|nr:hypothetical protein [Planctomycetota bacterium]
MKAGYDVHLVTLPDFNVRTYEPPPNVYGILAAPECREFSLAKGSRPRDFAAGLELVEAAERIIRRCRLAGPLQFWCMENPVGFLRQFLGKPPLTVHYWWYGDCIDKPTDLWGYFNFPKRIYKDPPALLPNWNKIKALKGVQNQSRATVRATTPPGFAQAFFKANT